MDDILMLAILLGTPAALALLGLPGVMLNAARRVFRRDCPRTPEVAAWIHGGEVTEELRAHVAGCEVCRRGVHEAGQVAVKVGRR